MGSSRTAIRDFASPHDLYCQKKRPATPAFRRELLRVARENRYMLTVEYNHKTGQPFTAEDRSFLRKSFRKCYMEARSLFVEADNRSEAAYWQMFAEYGIYTEGGLQ